MSEGECSFLIDWSEDLPPPPAKKKLKSASAMCGREEEEGGGVFCKMTLVSQFRVISITTKVSWGTIKFKFAEREPLSRII